jgi:hypothetical protein
MSRHWTAKKKPMSRERLVGNDALLSVLESHLTPDAHVFRSGVILPCVESIQTAGFAPLGRIGTTVVTGNAQITLGGDKHQHGFNVEGWATTRRAIGAGSGCFLFGFNAPEGDCGGVLFHGVCFDVLAENPDGCFAEAESQHEINTAGDRSKLFTWQARHVGDLKSVSLDGFPGFDASVDFVSGSGLGGSFGAEHWDDGIERGGVFGGVHNDVRISHRSVYAREIDNDFELFFCRESGPLNDY